MTEFIFFLIGLLLGGSIGITLMCCLQINRLSDNSTYRKENKDFYEKDC